MAPQLDLDEWFGEIDIYLFDQLLKGRIRPEDQVLDAGCGEGRNLVHGLRCGWEVSAVDRSVSAVESVRRLAERLAPQLPARHFRVEELDALSFEDGVFDVVICNAVLHFADDEAHFERIVNELWRVLRPGGMFFARMASTIGLEDRIVPGAPRRGRSPDGVERFLVDESLLLSCGQRLGGDLLDPIKTTIVQDQRAMTTWCLRRGDG